jgi:hypothetical protein
MGERLYFLESPANGQNVLSVPWFIAVKMFCYPPMPNVFDKSAYDVYKYTHEQPDDN